MSGRIRTHALSGAAIGLIAMALGAGAFSTGVSASTCEAWAGLQPPDPSSSSNVLFGVAALSPCNAWAVGQYFVGSNQTHVGHWDGSTWIQETSQNPAGSSHDNILNAVAATSSSNAWAVGTYRLGAVDQTLIEHRTGTNWVQVSSPNPAGSTDNILKAVAVTSSSNAWAVGASYIGAIPQTLIEHWNGTAWKHVSSPNPGGSSNFKELNGVSAISPTDVWAVGYYYNGSAYQTLIEHWNGTGWKHVSSPNPGGSSNSHNLTGVAATSASNAWAVGYYFNGSGNQTLIEQWNGKNWTRVSSPNPGDPFGDNYLAGVAATSAGNVWAVGDYTGGSAFETLAIHCC